MGEIEALPAGTPGRTHESSTAVRGRELVWFALAFVVLYAAVATLLFRYAPSLFLDLDEAFEADLGSWTVDLARPQGPHLRTRIHPLSVLLLNPARARLWTLLFATSATQVVFSALPESYAFSAW